MTEPGEAVAADDEADPASSRLRGALPFLALLIFSAACVYGAWPWLAAWNADYEFRKSATLRDKDGASHLVLLFRGENSSELIFPVTTVGNGTSVTFSSSNAQGKPGGGALPINVTTASNVRVGKPSSVKTVSPVKTAVLSTSFPVGRGVRGYLWSGWRWRSYELGGNFGLAGFDESRLRVVSTKRGDALITQALMGTRVHVVEDGELVELTGKDLEGVLGGTLSAPVITLESEVEVGPATGEAPAKAEGEGAAAKPPKVR